MTTSFSLLRICLLASLLCLHILVLDPVLELSLDPFSLPLVRVFGVDDPAYTMLHAIVPLTPILASVGVSVGALSVLLVVAIVSFVAATVLPHVDAVSMHDTVLERSLEVTTICPLETPVAAHLVLAPHTRVL